MNSEFFKLKCGIDEAKGVYVAPSSVVYISKPYFVDDGDMSFYSVTIGVGANFPGLNKLNSFLRSEPHVLDMKFSAPQKKFKGLRINSVGSDYGTKKSIGAKLRNRLETNLKSLGFSVEMLK